MPLADRLAQLGSARVVGALAVACIVLFVALAASLWVNVLQMRGKARAVGEVMAQLAAAQAQATAEVAECEAVNGRQSAAVTLLEGELAQCRGQQQQMQDALALAHRQRDRARSEITALEQQRTNIIHRLVIDYANDCNRPICRALSDELLRAGADRHQ